MVKRLQNRIAESRLTLPLVAVYGLLVCVACGFFIMGLDSNMWKDQEWLSLVVLTGLSTLFMVELNNSNSLIRIYSRTVSCSFLMLTLMATFQFTSLQGSLVQLAFIVFYLFFLRAYQNKQDVGNVYSAFLAIGVASIWFIQILYFVPLFWLLLGIRVQAFSGKTLFASILGLITPYWFLLVYFLYQADYRTPIRHFLELGQFAKPADIFILSEHQLVTVAFVILLALTGMIHFLRQSSNDKLRTQMVYELFIMVTLYTIAFLVLQPQHYDFLFRILVVNTATFIGHFIALTRTKITNVAFIVIVLSTLFLTAYNLWNLSLMLS